MAIDRIGGIAPNRARIPKKWSDYMLANYYADNVVPNISNHDYEGEIANLGDTVIIQKRFAIQTFDYKVGQALQKQTNMADESVQLTIDYSHYFNVPIADVDKLQAMGDWPSEIFDEAARAIATKIEQKVLQSIPGFGATSVGTPGSRVNVGLSGTDRPAIAVLMQAQALLNTLNVPDDGNRYAVVDPTFAYMLALGDLKAAYMTGDSESSLRNGVQVLAKPVAGLRVYVSNNLATTGTLMATGQTVNAIVGHLDALTFAAQINKTETLRDPDDFGDLLRGQVVYGFKVIKPEALCTLYINYNNFS